MELLKDYDCSILYHPDKDNVVANTLSRKSASRLLTSAQKGGIKELHELIDQELQ